MKKTIIGIGLLLLLTVVLWAFLYRTPQVTPVIVPEPSPTATTTPIVGSPKNATYSIEGIPVTLVNGSAQTPTVPGSASMVETNYFGNEVTYDLNNDGRMDTVFLLTQSTGGTGVFYYVVAALNTTSGYRGSEGVRLGDRITPQSTRMSSEPGRVGVVEVTYADRAPSDSFAVAPTIGKSLLLKFDPTTMQFGTVEPNFAGEANPSILKLTQKKWQWVRTNYTDGRVFVPNKTTAFSLTFGTDGKVSGTTDCNSLGGPYTTAGTSSVLFGRMAMTKMYCDGSEEGVFADALGQVNTYSFTSKGELQLGLKSNSGTMIMQ